MVQIGGYVGVVMDIGGFGMDPYAGMSNDEVRDHRERIVREVKETEKAIEERRDKSMCRVLDLNPKTKKKKNRLFRP